MRELTFIQTAQEQIVKPEALKIMNIKNHYPGRLIRTLPHVLTFHGPEEPPGQSGRGVLDPARIRFTGRAFQIVQTRP